MIPVVYIPLWFNVILFIFSIILIGGSVHLLISKDFPWFLALPIFAYGFHFAVFYGFITFSQLTSQVLDAETMTLWSAILRFQGLITWICMLIIINFSWGRKK